MGLPTCQWIFYLNVVFCCSSIIGLNEAFMNRTEIRMAIPRYGQEVHILARVPRPPPRPTEKKLTFDDLALIKEQHERKFAGKLFSNATIAIVRKKELYHCDNFVQDSQKSLDCRSWEAHKTGQDVPSKSYCDSFVRKTSLKLKLKLGLDRNFFPLPLPDLTMDLNMFPMINHVIRDWSQSIFDAYESLDKDFTKLKLSMGYFYEFNITNPFNTRKLINCQGMALGTINRTELLPGSFSKPEPKFFEELPYYLGQASRNGYMLSLQRFNCFEPGKGSRFALTGNFTIMKREKFPHVFARIDLVTKPDEKVFKFVGQIKQLPGDIGTPIKYTTDNTVVSKSSLYPLLNFKLYRRFFNEFPYANVIEYNGRSKSQNVLDNYGALFGESRWIAALFTRTLKWYSESRIPTNQEQLDEIETKEEAIEFNYVDDPRNGDDYVFQLKLKKNLFPPMFDDLLAELNLVEKSSQTDADKRDQLNEFPQIGPTVIQGDALRVEL